MCLKKHPFEENGCVEKIINSFSCCSWVLRHQPAPKKLDEVRVESWELREALHDFVYFAGRVQLGSAVPGAHRQANRQKKGKTH